MISPDEEEMHEDSNTNIHKRSNNLTYIGIGLSLILLIGSGILITRKNHAIKGSEISMDLEHKHQGGMNPSNDTSYHHSTHQDETGESTGNNNDHSPTNSIANLQDQDDTIVNQPKSVTNNNIQVDKQNTCIVEFSQGETMRAKFAQKSYNISLLNNIELYYNNESGRKIVLTSSHDALHYSKLGYIIYAIVPAHTQMELDLGN